MTENFTALRNGAQQHRFASDGPGIYAFSRMHQGAQREHVVAINNAETAQTAIIPTYSAGMTFRRVYGVGPGTLESGAGRGLEVTVQPLTAVVYRATRRVARSRFAPSIVLADPGLLRDRALVQANVGGSGFAQVTFQARVGTGAFFDIGTDDNAPYRVFHDVADIDPGTSIRYRAVVRDNGGNTRRSAFQSGTVAPPAISLEAPSDNGRVRGRVEVRAIAVPDRPTYVVRLERQIGDGEWTELATDDSSPVYTAFDDTSALADGTVVRYRAVLAYGGGRTVTSAPRSVTVVTTPVTTAIVHYNRPAGDYADWGLHLFGGALADGVATDWAAPRQRVSEDAFGAVFEVPLSDDTAQLCFIVHRPSGEVVPDTREPGGDRCFVPLEHPEIWLRQGDPAVYFSPLPDRPQKLCSGVLSDAPSTSAPDARFQIGEVADRVGLSLRTVRYYEEVGLLTPSARTPGGFRLYSEDDVVRLRILKGMKPFGLTLEEIRELMELLEDGERSGADAEQARAALSRYAQRANERMEQLHAHAAEVGRLRTRIDARLEALG